MIDRRRVELEYLVGPAAASWTTLLRVRGKRGARPGLARAAQPPETTFDVLHFIAMPAPTTGKSKGLARGDMVLYGENARASTLPGQAATARPLEGLAHEDLNPLLVFLNACQTVALDGEGAHRALSRISSPGQAAGRDRHAVSIGDDAAKTFAGAFYSALLRHGQVDWAVSIARNALAGDRPRCLPDWGMPVL